MVDLQFVDLDIIRKDIRKELIGEFLEGLDSFVDCYRCCIKANGLRKKWKKKLKE